MTTATQGPRKRLSFLDRYRNEIRLVLLRQVNSILLGDRLIGRVEHHQRIMSGFKRCKGMLGFHHLISGSGQHLCFK